MSKKKHPPGETGNPAGDIGRAISAGKTPVMPSLGVDWDFYMTMLEESDATDEEKRELIQTIWNIVVAFVDMGFGVHPIQQAVDDVCGQNETSKRISAIDWAEVVHSDHSSKPPIDQSADPTKKPPCTGSKT